MYRGPDGKRATWASLTWPGREARDMGVAGVAHLGGARDGHCWFGPGGMRAKWASLTSPGWEARAMGLADVAQKGGARNRRR